MLHTLAIYHLSYILRSPPHYKQNFLISMTEEELIKTHANALLKIIDREWQLTRPKLELAVRETVKNIIVEATVKARLEGNS